MASDSWLAQHEATCRMTQDIAENIQERNRQQRTGGNPAKVSVTIRLSLQNLNRDIGRLRDGLLRAASSNFITQREAERRQSLLDELETKDRQLHTMFSGNGGGITDSARYRLKMGLLGGGATGASSWLEEEPEDTRGRSFTDLRQQQKSIIQEQDAGLEVLSSIIARQKQMGHAIGNELETQNEIIDDLTNLVEDTDGRIRRTTKSVSVVQTKSANCGMLVVIVLLLIAIIVVAVWPK
ncbi:unnamed protein product [Lampetra planeri]